mmetsp:Transcript_15814/g.34625  ORF Transcript_15814/g.34625 Transcript_15814/m.34625 type:complete len:93 (-) Transcript_15814:380-658(-)
MQHAQLCISIPQRNWTPFRLEQSAGLLLQKEACPGPSAVWGIISFVVGGALRRRTPPDESTRRSSRRLISKGSSATTGIASSRGSISWVPNP